MDCETISIVVSKAARGFIDGTSLGQSPNDPQHGYGQAGIDFITKLQQRPARKNGSKNVRLTIDEAKVLYELADAMVVSASDAQWGDWDLFAERRSGESIMDKLAAWFRTIEVEARVAPFRAPVLEQTSQPATNDLQSGDVCNNCDADLAVDHDARGYCQTCLDETDGVDTSLNGWDDYCWLRIFNGTVTIEKWWQGESKTVATVTVNELVDHIDLPDDEVVATAMKWANDQGWFHDSTRESMTSFMVPIRRDWEKFVDRVQTWCEGGWFVTFKNRAGIDHRIIARCGTTIVNVADNITWHDYDDAAATFAGWKDLVVTYSDESSKL